MKIIAQIALVGCLLISQWGVADDTVALSQALTLHASFDTTFDADFSKGSKACSTRINTGLVPAVANDEVQFAKAEGRYGGALHFTKKGNLRPQFFGESVLGYNDKNWSTTVSVWLRLDPDKDLEPGYCDPVQIIGDDLKKGFIFLEWSKDETPRFFRYAIRPLFHIWNPTNIQWADIPFEKRPMVQVARAPFTRDAWTHVVFTLENINDKSKKPAGELYLNGQSQGRIENWDLTFGWNPAQVQLVLGAAYVGYLDDLGVFNRVLTAAEVKQVYQLKSGLGELHSK
ncbi:LamG-like jellyroll fold domain-containing protein [Schlesneria paludicola]|uniref:LamG-like jellyroll fold domain-containing protein n=1 Tax=Schlesneria paludicola TaxID=360056 RepID=UPI00029B2353|nr:LamG-like jellyroll fold domain-containing protein [Schlesneria paludicola]